MYVCVLKVLQIQTLLFLRPVFFFQKKFKIETEVENWIQKYDQDMGERQVGWKNRGYSINACILPSCPRFQRLNFQTVPTFSQFA